MKDEPIGTITHEDYVALDETLIAGPHKYSKRIRMYVDVDGVVMPFVYSQEDLDRLDGQNTINVFEPKQRYLTEDTNITSGRFVYNKFVAAKLSEWSHRDDIDFIWLTSWRINAPYALDKLLNIKSVGYLPWTSKMSEYGHAGKGRAIEAEQSTSPSKFVWLDDFANKSYYPGIPYFTEGFYASELSDTVTSNDADDFIVEEETIDSSQYLSITTKDTVGLSQENIETIDEWLLHA